MNTRAESARPACRGWSSVLAEKNLLELLPLIRGQYRPRFLVASCPEILDLGLQLVDLLVVLPLNLVDGLLLLIAQAEQAPLRGQRPLHLHRLDFLLVLLRLLSDQTAGQREHSAGEHQDADT